MGRSRSSRDKKGLTRQQRWVILLGLLISILGLSNLVRAAVAWRYAILLPELPLTLPLPYLVAMGGFWGVVFMGCAVGLARFRSWGRRGTLAATTLYELHVWANRLLFDASDYARQVWPRDLVLTLLLLGAIWGLLSWPSVRRVFQSSR